MAKKVAAAVSEDRVATPVEIDAAVESLSPADWYRLRKFADYHILLLQEKTGDRRGPDLLNAAFERLLEGSRKWDKTKVDFMGFLYGAMRSIANSWLRKKVSPTEAPVLASALVKEDDDGNLSDPAEEFASSPPDHATMLVYQKTLEQVNEVCADDQELQMVLEGFKDGLDPADIRKLWGLSQTEYNTIVRRMRRRLDGAGITDPKMEHRHVQ